MVNKPGVYLSAFLLCLLFITVTGQEQGEEQNTEQDLQAEQGKQQVVKGAKAWALACSAVLIEKNHGRHDLLGTVSITPRSRKKMQIFLAEESAWFIKSRSDLFDCLTKLGHAGHRSEFEQLGNMLQRLNDREYEALLRQSQDDPEALNRLKVVKNYYRQLTGKGLLGWDCARYICLCRWAYAAGYITEQEAWQEIIPLAKMLQDTFDSWEDLGLNYLIGRKFWSYEETINTGSFFEDAYQRLIDMKSSPWNNCPWDMDLTETDSIGEPNETDRDMLFVRN